jgi:hypothetical protein
MWLIDVRQRRVQMLTRLRQAGGELRAAELDHQACPL